ncbi:MAG TPA: alpha/beta fold hydrolase [Acidimicrobiia bacterium]
MARGDEPREPVDGSLGDALGVVEAAFDTTDPVALGRALARAGEQTLRRPWAAFPACARFATGVTVTGAGFAARFVGIRLPDTASADPKDARFRSPAWQDNPFFHALLETYLLAERLLREVVHAAQLEEPVGAKAEFAARLVADAVAPTNFLVTNPAALERAFETCGFSVLRGARNMLDDALHNDGWPRQVDQHAFRVGKDLAATPGRVVYRNELIEVIQYEPQGEQVREIPLVVCPPWINRYYIADLAPGKSLVEWAVSHGHTVFAVSYRNADESTRDLGFDDYIRLGPLTAIDVARGIVGSEQVNLLGICLGGTMNAMALAYLAACGDNLVHSATFLNSTVDYADAGTLATVFADPAAVDALARRMESKGYLPGKDMARTFDLLRANDLVFRYVVDSWLLGEAPPPFDLLAWNADSTNMPGKAHAHFLRKMYIENALARDQYVAMGERLLVSEIATDTYVVAAIEDHIVPWRVSYRSTQLFKGPVRFVLTSAGHIAGIVNPPSPKTRLWTNDELPSDPDRWFQGATALGDTWWNDWIAWLDARAGELQMPPSMGSASYPVLGDAPGTYVHT